TLRQNVTSKGGTTAAALQVFEQQQLPRTVASAMQAAVARAEEVEKLF
ncbi:pyrroline-5-carboxylate reductase, partial [Sodalis-like symbiont of Bactericera trigonica]